MTGNGEDTNGISMTLLEKAKAAPVGKATKSRSSPLEERFEVALAYADKRITGPQVAVALGVKGGAIVNACGAIMLQGYRAGLLVLAEKSRAL